MHEPIRIKQLAVTLATFSKLKFKTTLLIEYLDTMIVGIRNDNVILRIHRNSRWFRKLKGMISFFVIYILKN